MIMPGGEIKIFVATTPVDFCWQADGPAVVVQEALCDNPYSGAIDVSRPKRTDQTTFSIPIAIRRRSIWLTSPLRPAAADESTIGAWSERNYRRRSS
jgi:hypothetical protein